jgi:short subunit dehydrogenase-like uncharacterized protein
VVSDPILLYGAAGYTGRLILEAALARGLRPLVGGRDERKVRALAERHGLEARVARLPDDAALDGALRDVAVVLHAAGPYAETAIPMARACLRTGAHYLDLSGEVDAIEALARRHGEARRRRVMLMPAVGFDVVPTDCLAAHVAARLPGARRLDLAILGIRAASRGSTLTGFEHAFDGVRVRRGGEIVLVPWGALHRDVDWGNGPRDALACTWGDVATAWYTTGIPDVTVYFEATPPARLLEASGRYLGWLLRTAPMKIWLQAHVDVLPEGPSAEERASRRVVVVAEAEDAGGERVAARLETPEVYACTAMIAPAVAARAAAGDVEPGFQTPARIYGAEFVLGFPGIVRDDLDRASATLHAT